jgi:hypothetical protein
MYAVVTVWSAAKTLPDTSGLDPAIHGGLRVTLR